MFSLIFYAENHFFNNGKYLKDYTSASDKAKQKVPGHGYFRKVEEFYKSHVEIGLLHMEYRNAVCLNTMGTLCDYCQNSPLYVFKDYVKPVPRPFPDHSALPAYHYLSHKETPIYIDGETRPVDDFQPRVQLKKLFEAGEISSNNKSAIKDFCEKYIVEEKLVIEYVNHMEVLKLEREKSKQRLNNERTVETEKHYKDFDWIKLWETGELRKKSIKILDKYVMYHQLGKFKRKQDQLNAILRHISMSLTQENNNILRNRTVCNPNEMELANCMETSSPEDSLDSGDSDIEKHSSGNDQILSKFDSSDESSSSESENENCENTTNVMNYNSVLLALCGQLRTRTGRVVKPTTGSSDYLL